jgi:hypothetical protein
LIFLGFLTYDVAIVVPGLAEKFTVAILHLPRNCGRSVGCGDQAGIVRIGPSSGKFSVQQKKAGHLNGARLLNAAQRQKGLLR